MRRVGPPHKSFIIYYHISETRLGLCRYLVIWFNHWLKHDKNVCCAENNFKIFVLAFLSTMLCCWDLQQHNKLFKDSILVLSIVIICNCWSSKNHADGQTKIERVFVESAVVIFVIFPASALCTLWGEAGETSSQVGAYFGCGFTTLSFRWKKAPDASDNSFAILLDAPPSALSRFPPSWAALHWDTFSCSVRWRCSAPVLGLVSLAGGGLLWKAVGGVGGPRWV